MGLLVSTLSPYWNVLVNIFPDNQICEIIQNLDSVDTVLLKYKILNVLFKHIGKYQRNCQMWSVSGASIVYHLSELPSLG